MYREMPNDTLMVGFYPPWLDLFPVTALLRLLSLEYASFGVNFPGVGQSFFIDFL